MANFDAAFEVLIKHEGGFSNKTHDSGGATNHGITQNDLATWYNRPVSIEEVQKLSIDEAKKLYRIWFWEHMKLDSIQNTKLATLIFDQGVLRGSNRIIQDLQHLLKIDSDGIMGPHTIEALNKSDATLIGIKLIEECQLAYAHLVSIKPLQADFIVGWISRTHSLLDYLLFSV